MTLLDKAAQSLSLDPAEALIKEAHQRKRRRRFLVGGITAIVLAAAIGGFLLYRSGSGTPTPEVHAKPVAPGVPVVNRAAFAHHGRLAFVSRSTLWVLGGSTPSLREIHTPGLVPANPSFSPDRKWLAFVASKEVSHDYGGEVLSTVLSSQLWMARADGTDAHPMTGIASNSGIPHNTAFGWDPHADLFAVSVGNATTVPFGYATDLDLVSPTGSVRPLVANTHVTSAVWSPDGSAMAVSTEVGSLPSGRPSATLSTYSVGGGPPTIWESNEPGFIVPAGWWPAWGIGYTTVDSGAVPGGSATADGSPFYAIAGPGAPPRSLGTTLQDESTGTPSATSTGWLAFVGTSVNGGGRTIWQGKEVVVCSPVSTECSPVPHPTGTVTVDPVWSPNGSTLAYVQGPALQSVAFPQQVVSTWYNAHQLFLYDPASGSVQANAHAQGATVPLWSHNGRGLLYVRNNGLWMNATLARSPVEIAQPLFTSDWPAFYGQVAFSSQFSWSPQRNSPHSTNGSGPLTR